MTVEMITRTIQLILAPVVMVSACGLLLNGLPMQPCCSFFLAQLC